MLPMPNMMTKTAVILFLDCGNCVHMQFSIGIELRANIEPGIIIEHIVNVYILKTNMFISGNTKNSIEQIFIIN